MTEQGLNHEQRLSPLMMRRYLGELIVHLRTALRMSQARLAEEVHVSKQTVEAWDRAGKPLPDARDIPLGRVPQPDDLRSLLRVFDVPEQEHDQWFEIARVARSPGRYDRYNETDLPLAAKMAANYEWGARRLRVFSGSFVPALLQTPLYAEGLLAVHLQGRSKEQIDQSVSIRQMRQEILDHPDRVEYHAIIDQAALERMVHGLPGAVEQLERMAEVAADQTNKVTLQIVPWSAGHYRAHAGNFLLMDFGLLDHLGLLQVEPGLADPVHASDRSEIYFYSEAFDEAAKVALSPDETIDLLQRLTAQTKGVAHDG